MLGEQWGEGGVVGVEDLPSLGYEGLREGVEEGVFFWVWWYRWYRRLGLVAGLRGKGDVEW